MQKGFLGGESPRFHRGNVDPNPQSCDAGGPLVAPTTSGLSEPLPTDKQNVWPQVPPNASKIFVSVFFKIFFKKHNFPIRVGAFPICNLNLWNSGVIEMQLLFISHLILFLCHVLTGLGHFNPSTRCYVAVSSKLSGSVLLLASVSS